MPKTTGKYIKYRVYIGEILEIGKIDRIVENRGKFRNFIIFQFFVVNNHKIRNLEKFHCHTYIFGQIRAISIFENFIIENP